MKKGNGFLHGGDYNADQWLDRPDILKEDLRLMKLAGVNCVTLGVFAWSALEPEEGKYTFDWLDRLMDSMYENGISVVLATPSAGKPPWLVRKYPEVMRMNENRVRLLYGERENQCNSSEIFREKVKKLDGLLARRYAHHPALVLWHVSNEMYGTCHCPACQENFRRWLKQKYGTLENLNREYWSGFWSHRYQDWEELESPAPHGETAVHALALDYRRFYSDLSIDFLKMEIDTVKQYNPEIPVTTNFFHLNCGFDYRKLARSLDVIAWDMYPAWHMGKREESEWEAGMNAAFYYDVCRSLKKKPFLLMETTPSVTNWAPVDRLKRPGVHKLGCLEAVACGSDSVQYFQWRKGRGGFEKFHGAVVGHDGTEHTRVFHEVSELGRTLKEMKRIAGSESRSSVAVIFDWENMGALEEQKSLRSENRQFEEIIKEHHEALTRNYVSVDVIGREDDFSPYRLIAAPLLYQFSEKTAEKIRSYVEQGGIFVSGFYSGLVNENDLVYEGWAPHDLNEVFGVWAEEVDCLRDGDRNAFRYRGRSYQASFYCELPNRCDAKVLASYEKDFYRGKPAVTEHSFGEGKAYYIACRAEMEFLQDFYRDLIRENRIARIIEEEYVQDVMVKERGDGRFLFLMNFSREPRRIGDRLLDGYEVRMEDMGENPGGKGEAEGGQIHGQME